MNRIVINADLVRPDRHVISRHVYGHFSEHLGRCIYGGYWVDEGLAVPNTRRIRDDVVEALKAIKTPNVRWPGGCFADEYHWMDGVGPREKRPSMVNTHWGGVTEDNSFGTHEFLDLCAQLECEPYICGNVGSGTVREMQQWAEYITLDGMSPMSDLRRANGREEPWKISYWGVGNESWGCGGRMRPEYYADQFNRYACYLRDLSGNKLRRIACGPSGANYRWTEVLMENARNMWGLALHYYCGTGKKSRSATEFGEEDWFEQLKRALRMDELVTRHSAVMDRYDPEKKVALVVDEWGAWHAVEPGTNPRFLYQQNSLRDALVASVTLDIFNRHCERVRMANIAQTVNVLQAMILTEENGERMLLTPTYHVFEMYRAHHDATRLPLALECGRYEMGEDSIPQVSASASRDAGGRIHLTISNLDPGAAADFTCEVRGAEVSSVAGRVLTADAITAHNTFDAPETVKPVPFEGARLDSAGPGGAKLTITLPARSVVALEIA